VNGHADQVIPAAGVWTVELDAIKHSHVVPLAHIDRAAHCFKAVRNRYGDMSEAEIVAITEREFRDSVLLGSSWKSTRGWRVVSLIQRLASLGEALRASLHSCRCRRIQSAPRTHRRAR
jgi:hypothetical protein